MTGFHITRILDTDFDRAVARVTEELQKEGFGILTEIDVRETLKKKLDLEFRPYRILGACNPALAHQALQADDKIGVLLPCNVVVQQTKSGRIEVSVMNPSVAMAMGANHTLGAVVEEVTSRLERILAAL